MFVEIRGKLGLVQANLGQYVKSLESLAKA